VIEFGDPAGARGFQRWAINHTCDEAAEAFEIVGVPGAVGLRFHDENASRPIIERVSFVLGNRRYSLELSRKVDVPREEERALDLARWMWMAAHIPGSHCRVNLDAIERVEAAAEQGSPGRIKRLRSLVPGKEILEFTMDAGSSFRYVDTFPSGDEVPVYRRSWGDGWESRLEELVTQYPRRKMASRGLRAYVDLLCEGSSSSFAEPEWLPGAVMVVRHNEFDITHHLLFIRGLRLYELVYGTVEGAIRMEVLEGFANEALGAAR